MRVAAFTASLCITCFSHGGRSDPSADAAANYSQSVQQERSAIVPDSASAQVGNATLDTRPQSFEAKLGSHGSSPSNKDSLPAVSDMLSHASGIMSKVESQAKVMQARIQSKQELATANLAELRSSYENELKKQTEAIRSTRHSNKEIYADISEQQNENYQLRTSTAGLQQSNEALRQVFTNMLDEFSLASQFLGRSLTDMIDDEATLEALKPATPRPLLDFSFPGEDNMESDRSLPLSFVQGREEPDEDPMSDYLGVMSQTLADLEREEEQGEEKLRVIFQTAYENRNNRLEQLLQNQHELNVTRDASRDEREKLLAAQARLTKTRQQFRERISGLQEFANTIEEAATTAAQLPDRTRPTGA